MSDISKLSYWFNQTITDGNGNTITDINAGLRKLLPDLMPELNNLSNNYTTFAIDETILGQPDYIAHTMQKNHNLFWYVCLANLITNPFEGFDTEHIYYSFDKSYLTSLSTKQAAGGATQPTNQKVGKIITLN